MSTETGENLQHAPLPNSQEANQDEEQLASKQILTSDEEDIIDNLKHTHDFEDILDQMEDSQVPMSFINTPAFQHVTKVRLADLLITDSLDQANELINTSFLSEEGIRQTVKKAMIRLTTLGAADEAIALTQTYNIESEYINSPEMQNAALHAALKMIKDGNPANIKNLSPISLPTDLASSDQGQQAAQEGIERLLRGANLKRVKAIQDFANLPLESFHTSEMRRAAINGISHHAHDIGTISEIIQMTDLTDKEIKNAVLRAVARNLSPTRAQALREIQETYHISNKDVQEVAYNQALQYLTTAQLDRLTELQSSYGITDEDLNTPNAMQHAQNGVVLAMQMGKIQNAIALTQRYNFPEHFFTSNNVQQIAENAIRRVIDNGDTETAQSLQHALNIPPAKINSIATSIMVNQLYDGSIEEAKKISTAFSIKTEFADKTVRSTLVMHMVDNQKDIVRRMITSFELSDEYVEEVAQEILQDALSDNDYHTAVNVNQFLAKPDKTLTATHLISGGHGTELMYKTAKALLEGNIPKDAAQLGVTTAGERGIQQLSEIFLNFERRMLNESFDPQEILNSDLLKQHCMAHVRYEESEWGEGDTDTFTIDIVNFMRRRANGTIRALPTYQTPSGSIQVDKISKDSQASFKYSEQFLNRYATLQRSIRESLHLFENNKPLTHLSELAETKKAIVLEKLHSKLAAQNNPKAIEDLTKRIHDLTNINLRSVKDFQENFTILSQFNEFHDDLRQLIFYFALHKHQGARLQAQEIASTDTPTFENISQMINFINHITNEETWRKYFTDPQATKSFERLTNVSALQEEFGRAQNQNTNGTTTLDFIPTRGLLLEFSGQIGDACWATKYKSISEKFPNFSSMTIVQNRGNKHERLAGASLLIETTAKDGTPLLVIRGLNPLENVINRLSVRDFVEKTVAYLKQLAEKDGRKLAIIIDDHVSGSCTNRPVLFDYLNNLRPTLTHTELESRKDTKFNGYNITQDAFLI